MRILGLPMLEAFKKDHAASRGHWTRGRRMSSVRTGKHHMTSSADTEARISWPTTESSFDIKGNSYRLVVKVRYQNGLVVVEWVGTHAEYDKKKF
jgi:mRNA interferase HigB